MATAPEPDFFDDALSCVPCLNDDGDDAGPSSFQGTIRNHHLRQAEMKESEDLLAAEMNKLSVQERSRALEDVHCVAEELQETPEMIERALREFDQVVQTVGTNDRIYTIAWNQNRSYVEDPSFRLKFLRANTFDVRKSVDQMMDFLRQKGLYFGEEKVAHDIRAEDMNEEEIAVMRSGFFQILKDRDQSGRVILYNATVPRVPFERKVETPIHVLYHIIFNNVLSIPSAQTKGVVVIYYDESKGENMKKPEFNNIAKAQTFLRSLPMRFASIHGCLHSSATSLTFHNKLVQVALKALPKRIAPRTRLHYGSDVERQYQLQSFGIPLDSLPVDKNGNIRNEIIQNGWWNEYLQNVTSVSRNQQASHRNASDLINAATDGMRDTDVLLGRGKLTLRNPGNIHFRKQLQAHAEDYNRLSRHERKRACISYTRQLTASGTRFLRQTERGLWVECDFDEAVDKVAQFFRTLRRSRKEQAG